MKLLLTTIAAVLVATTAFASPSDEFLVSEQNSYTSSYPIHDAAYDGDPAGVQAELDKGVDVDARDYGIWDGWTPLHEVGTKEIAELLIAAGADVNAKNENGTTPLHFADTKEIAELLIAAGANVNAKADYGETPLDEAINLENTKTADLLRKHGGKTGEELKAEQK